MIDVIITGFKPEQNMSQMEIGVSVKVWVQHDFSPSSTWADHSRGPDKGQQAVSDLTGWDYISWSFDHKPTTHNCFVK